MSISLSSPYLKRLLHIYVKPYLLKIIAALFCMLILSAATGGLAWIMEPMIDKIFIEQRADLLLPVSLGILALFFLKGAATYGQSVLMNAVGQRIISNLQQDLFKHLIYMDLAFFQKNNSGKLTARFTYDIALMRNMVTSTLTSIGKDIFSLIFLIGVMFYQDWVFSCVAFFAFPLAVYPIIRIGQKLRKVSHKSQHAYGDLTSLLQQAFQGIRLIKSYALETYQISYLKTNIEHIYKLVMKATIAKSLSHPIMEFLGGLAIIAVVIYGGLQVIEGTKTAGTFFSFISAFLFAYEPMKKLANLNANLQEGMAALIRVFDLLDEKPHIIDAPITIPLKQVKGDIVFDHVHFNYTPDNKTNTAILHDLSFHIKPHSCVAFVGPSGAGKSTILNLILRFYDVEKGAIKIDGIDIRQFSLQDLRKHVALVSQDVTLFDDTIEANIRFGKYDASLDEIKQAAHFAFLDTFIESLPQGYQTRVGELGTKLSGGQKQRIAIARAFLKNSPILLLDEATSALDMKSEREIQKALETLMKNRTTLIVAHRLSTITHADCIFVLKDGKVVEYGQHEILLNQSGSFYKTLYQTQ